MTKRICVLLTIVGFWLLLGQSEGWANWQKEEDVPACRIDRKLSQKGFVIARYTTSGTMALTRSTLAAMLHINRKSAGLSRRLGRSKVSLRAIGFWGPAKAFVRANIPIINGNMQVLNQIENKTRVQKFHKVFLRVDTLWGVTSGIITLIHKPSRWFCNGWKKVQKRRTQYKRKGDRWHPQEQTKYAQGQPLILRWQGEDGPLLGEGEQPGQACLSSATRRLIQAQKKKVRVLAKREHKVRQSTSKVLKELRERIRDYRRIHVSVKALRRYQGTLRSRQSRLRDARKILLREGRRLRYWRKANDSQLRKAERIIGLLDRALGPKVRQLRKTYRSLERKATRAIASWKKWFARKSAAWNKRQAPISRDILGVAGLVEKHGRLMQQIKTQLRGTDRTIAAVKKKLERMEKGMNPILKTTDELYKALHKRICVRRKCFQVIQIIRGINGVIRPIQRLLEKAAGKLLNPILRKLKRHLPRIKVPDLNPVRRKLQQATQRIHGFQRSLKRYKPNTMQRHVKAFKQMSTEVRKLR